MQKKFEKKKAQTMTSGHGTTFCDFFQGQLSGQCRQTF